MAYTTNAQVGAFLQTTFDGTTTPTSTTIDEWILEASSEIDTITKTTFEAVTVTDEIISYNSDNSAISADKFDVTGAYGQSPTADKIKLPYKNMLTLTSVEYNTAGKEQTPVWESKTIGYGGDVILDGDYIKLLKSTYPRQQPASIRFSGTYGDTSMPKFIQKLATRMVALEVMNSQINTEVSQGGGSLRVGDIEITESSNFTSAFINDTRTYVEDKLRQLGTHQTYLI